MSRGFRITRAAIACIDGDHKEALIRRWLRPEVYTKVMSRRALAKALAAAMVMPVVSACASVTAPESEFRITEYGSGFIYGLFQGELGGCRIVGGGKLAKNVSVEYRGEKCNVILTGESP